MTTKKLFVGLMVLAVFGFMVFADTVTAKSSSSSSSKSISSKSTVSKGSFTKYSAKYPLKTQVAKPKKHKSSGTDIEYINGKSYTEINYLPYGIAGVAGLLAAGWIMQQDSEGETIFVNSTTGEYIEAEDIPDAPPQQQPGFGVGFGLVGLLGIMGVLARRN